MTNLPDIISRWPIGCFCLACPQRNSPLVHCASNPTTTVLPCVQNVLQLLVLCLKPRLPSLSSGLEHRLAYPKGLPCGQREDFLSTLEHSSSYPTFYAPLPVFPRPPVCCDGHLSAVPRSHRKSELSPQSNLVVVIRFIVLPFRKGDILNQLTLVQGEVPRVRVTHPDPI